MLIGLFTGNALQVFLYYLIFLMIDASVSIMAYIFEGERLWVLLWVIPQRFFYSVDNVLRPLQELPQGDKG